MTQIRNIVLISISMILLSCHSSPQMRFKGANETEKLNNFFEYSFNLLLERKPQEMAHLGIKKREGELNDVSLDFYQETIRIQKKHLEILKSFNFEKLTPQAKLSYELFELGLKEAIDGSQWRDYKYQVNQMFGIHSQIPGFMINIHQVKSEKDLKDYISRLTQFKRLFGQVITNLMRSETRGIVPPQFVFPKVIMDSKNIITGYPLSPERIDSPLWSDFRKKLMGLKLSKEKNKKYEEEAVKALKTSVGPAYKQLIAFLEKQEGRATKEDGAWKFPKGSEYYTYRLKKMTTTEMSADEIHKLGLDNVKRIHKDMKAIKKKVGFKGSLSSFFKHVNGKKFQFPDNKKGKKAYLKKATALIDNMKTQLNQLFITQPKASIRVKAVEAFREKSAGLAFYQRPSLDGSRPGTYYVNLYNMKALPQWEAEALAYHEGIPGHHMQGSIAQELKGIPMFRKMIHFTAYSEGWGLYSERLPKEYGFYKDPYSDFGRLSMELVRACRLVVDTGIHHKKWSREQAIAYLDKNTPGDHKDNIRQINRYIVLPGQATAYMVGMLKILDLRKKAEKALGSKYDIRKFHEVVLTNGPVPLKTLEKLVSEYIKKEQAI